MPSNAATLKPIMACKRLPPYVRRPVRSENIAVIDIGRFRACRNKASRPRGGVVTQRTANPRTPVQFRAWPPALTNKMGLSEKNGARTARIRASRSGQKLGQSALYCSRLPPCAGN